MAIGGPAPPVRARRSRGWWALLAVPVCLAAIGAVIAASRFAALDLGGPSWAYTGDQLVSIINEIGAPQGFQPVLGGPAGYDGSDALGEETAPTASVGYDSPDQAAAFDTGALDTWATQRLGALGLPITPSGAAGISAACGDLEIEVTVDGAGSFPLDVTATGSAGASTHPKCPAEISDPPARTARVPTAAPSPSRGSSTVLAWGGSSDGALGAGATSDQVAGPLQVPLPAGTTIRAIGAGDDVVLALTSTGSVLAWGDGQWGELGDGAMTDSEFPVTVDLPVGTVATAIAAGEDFALALTSTGAVYAWGDNFFGDLGDGSTVESDVPLLVPLGAGARATAIAAGRYHALALIAGRPNCVLAWGDNREEEVGGGGSDQLAEPGGEVETPVYTCLPAGSDVTGVAAGGDFSLALTSVGSVYSWGSNGDGELGDAAGRESASPVPVDLPAGTRVTALAAGLAHALALTSDGRLLAWGDNLSGDLGRGTTAETPLPAAVSLPSGVRVTAIAAAGWSSLALTTNGTVLSWGAVTSSIVSDVDRPSPEPMPSGLRVSQIAAGDDFWVAAT